MLQAAAGNHQLLAVVSEGAGESSVRETWLRGPRAALGISEAAVQTTATAMLSDSRPPPSLESAAERIAPGAAFFIDAGHGSGGEDLNRTYYRSAHEPKAIWEIPEARHTQGYSARPAEYERRVVAFFDRYLHPR